MVLSESEDLPKEILDEFSRMQSDPTYGVAWAGRGQPRKVPNMDVYYAQSQGRARKLVFEYVKARLEKTDTHVMFAEDEVYVVWFSRTLQNWKCLISTALPDGMYYEVTHNGDKHETYIDAYKKFDNVCVPDEV